MGTDIHSVVQIRKNGQWRTVNEKLENSRNYDMFAILADVRNGYGFAGCNTGDGFIPISESKGFPEDFELTDYEYHGDEWMGDHSHSYLTLKEILDYPHWNESTLKRGYVTEKEYLELRKTKGSATCYCGGVGGANIVTMTMGEYCFLEENDSLPKNVKRYVHYEWSKSYKENGVYTEIIPALTTISEIYKVPPEDVRMVFGFDS